MADTGHRPGRRWRTVWWWVRLILVGVLIALFGGSLFKWLRGQRAKREGTVDEIIDEIELEARKARELEQARLDALPDDEIVAPDRIEHAAAVRRERARATGQRERDRLFRHFGLSEYATGGDPGGDSG